MHFNTLNVKIYSLDIQFYDFFYFYDFINCQFTGFQPVCKCKKKLKSETKQRIYILIPLTVSISVVLLLFKWRKLLKTFWILKQWIEYNIRFPSINFHDIFKDVTKKYCLLQTTSWWLKEFKHTFIIWFVTFNLKHETQNYIIVQYFTDLEHKQEKIKACLFLL